VQIDEARTAVQLVAKMVNREAKRGARAAASARL